MNDSTITSRERVLIALKHEEPDRIPIDFGSTHVSTINPLSYRDLRKYLGLVEKPARVKDVVAQLTEVDADILQIFHIDLIDVNRHLPPTTGEDYYRDLFYQCMTCLYRESKTSRAEIYEQNWKQWTHRYLGFVEEIPACIDIVEEGDSLSIYLNKSVLLGKGSKTSSTFSPPDAHGVNPLANAKNVEDVKNFDWELFKVSDRYVEYLKKKSEYLYKNTKYALVFSLAGRMHAWAQGLRGWTRWLSDLRLRKSLAEAVLDHIMDVLMYNVKKYVEAFGEYVQVIGFADDLGTEEGPQISIQTFRDVYKHRYEEIFSYIKRHSKMYVFLHSDGAIFPLIKEFIDIGLDIINPIQLSAKGMDPEKLKKEYGEQITFWGGGADVQHVLPFAKVDEVVQHVKNLIKIFAPRGGFIFATTHNIQPPTPPENIVSVFKTAYENGRYLIR
ncbi:MAG: uroporphyrinogen decarboxylase family protein [Ignisphaera sp.]